jgi:hypothetical protein
MLAVVAGVAEAMWRRGRRFAAVCTKPNLILSGLPFVAYGLASTVSVACVAGRRHSPSDAFVGSAMGFFIGDYVYGHHHAPSTKANAALWLANHVNIGFQVSH